MAVWAFESHLRDTHNRPWINYCTDQILRMWHGCYVSGRRLRWKRVSFPSFISSCLGDNRVLSQLDDNRKILYYEIVGTLFMILLGSARHFTFKLLVHQRQRSNLHSNLFSCGGAGAESQLQDAYIQETAQIHGRDRNDCLDSPWSGLHNLHVLPSTLTAIPKSRKRGIWNRIRS